MAANKIQIKAKSIKALAASVKVAPEADMIAHEARTFSNETRSTAGEVVKVAFYSKKNASKASLSPVLNVEVRNLVKVFQIPRDQYRFV